MQPADALATCCLALAACSAETVAARRPTRPAAATGIPDIRCAARRPCPAASCATPTSRADRRARRAAPPRRRPDRRRERRRRRRSAARSRTPMPTRRSRTRTSSCSRARARAWRSLGTARTDDEGRFSLALTGDARLPVGLRDLYGAVADGTGVWFLAFVAPDGARVIVSDIDGTLTSNGERVPDLDADRLARRRAAGRAGRARRGGRGGHHADLRHRARRSVHAGDRATGSPTAASRARRSTCRPPSSRCPAATTVASSSATSSRRSSSGSTSSPRSATARATSSAYTDAGVTAIASSSSCPSTARSSPRRSPRTRRPRSATTALWRIGGLTSQTWHGDTIFVCAASNG